jgi:hypothetical protein
MPMYVLFGTERESPQDFVDESNRRGLVAGIVDLQHATAIQLVQLDCSGL